MNDENFSEKAEAIRTLNRLNPEIMRNADGMYCNLVMAQKYRSSAVKPKSLIKRLFAIFNWGSIIKRWISYGKIRKHERIAEEYRQKAEDIYNSQEYVRASALIPEDLQDYDVIIALNKIVERGRADSWKELMNAYTSDYYHEQILAVNIAQLDAQQQGNQITLEMEDLLRSSLELQGYQTLVDFASLGNSIYQNKILEKHHKEMTRIRRSTKKTAKAASFLAYCRLFKK